MDAKSEGAAMERLVAKMWADYSLDDSDCGHGKSATPVTEPMDCKNWNELEESGNGEGAENGDA